jgi:hypothetical protein
MSQHRNAKRRRRRLEKRRTDWKRFTVALEAISKASQAAFGAWLTLADAFRRDMSALAVSP